MRLYILGASAWLVIGVRYAFHALRSVTARARQQRNMQLANPEPSPVSHDDLLGQDDFDPRIARIINEIPRRRVRHHA